MRKIFSHRARVVVYLENEAVDRMLAQAKSEGKTLVEWARETLLGGLGDNSDVPRARAVRVARRRAVAASRPDELASEQVAPVLDSDRNGDAGRTAEDVSVIEAEIARKSGHPVGCDCAWVCSRMRRMMK